MHQRVGGDAATGEFGREFSGFGIKDDLVHSGLLVGSWLLPRLGWTCLA